MEKVIHTSSTQSSAPQMPTQPMQNNNPVVKKVNLNSSKAGLKMAIIAILVILAGIGTGFKLSGTSFGKGENTKVAAPGAKVTSTEAGRDIAECNTEAEGKLEEGGIDGEGTHKLIRSADVSKNVYLGSTVIDLQMFVGKKVKVTGQTISGKKAGWLMDVCKIKITE